MIFLRSLRIASSRAACRRRSRSAALRPGETAFYLHEDVLQSRGLALLLFDDAAGYAAAGVTGWISLIIIFARVNDEFEPVRIIRTLALVECDRGVHDIHRKRSTLQARASSACRRRAGLPVPSCRVSCSLD